MDAKEEMAKQRAVIEYILKNKLTRQEAEEYVKAQGVTIQIVSVPRAATREQWEAGQRFMDSGDADDSAA
jgi:hypothetical protein